MIRRLPRIANPGSRLAREDGCICPRMDNANGAGYLGGNGKNWEDDGIYVVVVGCPLHDPRALREEDPNDHSG